MPTRPANLRHSCLLTRVWTYGWFTEGFGMLGLKQAGTMLPAARICR
jgi:hypothetical protein